MSTKNVKKKKSDWLNIKMDYVNGIEKEGKRLYPSFRDLQNKYGTAFNTIAERAKREDWLSERQITINKIEHNRTVKTIEQISNKGIEFDLKSFEIARKLQAKLDKQLKDLNDLSAKEISLLVSSIKTNQSIAKEALGETPTEKETIIISPELIPDSDK